MVSVDKSNNVIGFLSAEIYRMVNKVSSIGAINFYNTNVVFSRDFYKFLTELFDVHNFNKIEWEVSMGNPAERMYDKIINKFGGRVVGIRHEAVKLHDGIVCDVKEYEIFKRDYEKHKPKRRIK